MMGDMSMKIQVPFDQFLACHAAREDGTVGAFARAAAKDPLFPSSANYRDYRDHLSGAGVLSWVEEGFEDAWEEYSDLRFAATVFVTRSGDDSWCLMFNGEELDYISRDQSFEDARLEVEKSMSAISGKKTLLKYDFDGGSFAFPTVREVVIDAADLALDIEMDDYVEGFDLEIARAICDHIIATTNFCARFEEEDVLSGWVSDADQSDVDRP